MKLSLPQFRRHLHRLAETYYLPADAAACWELTELARWLAANMYEDNRRDKVLRAYLLEVREHGRAKFERLDKQEKIYIL
jgi:hypothetical protein